MTTLRRNRLVALWALSCLAFSTWAYPKGSPQTQGSPDPVPPPLAEKQEKAQGDEKEPVTLPVGQVIEVRVADLIRSNHNHTGDLFTGIVDPSVFVNRQV